MKFQQETNGFAINSNLYECLNVKKYNKKRTFNAKEYNIT